jgi:hypothetical protein
VAVVDTSNLKDIAIVQAVQVIDRPDFGSRRRRSILVGSIAELQGERCEVILHISAKLVFFLLGRE